MISEPLVIGFICFMAGMIMALLIFLSLKKKDGAVGCIILNSDPEKPLFELRFFEDPKKFEDGAKMIFELKLR